MLSVAVPFRTRDWPVPPFTMLLVTVTFTRRSERQRLVVHHERHVSTGKPQAVSVGPGDVDGHVRTNVEVGGGIQRERVVRTRAHRTHIVSGRRGARWVQNAS